jgi:hypothetical protein
MDAQEALDALAALGPFDSTQKQMWRADHYDQWVELEHPSRKTYVDKDGNPVSVDDTDPATRKGVTEVPAKVVVTASRVDDYVAKGFTVPQPAAVEEEAPRPRRRAAAAAKTESTDGAGNGQEPKE